MLRYRNSCQNYAFRLPLSSGVKKARPQVISCVRVEEYLMIPAASLHRSNANQPSIAPESTKQCNETTTAYWPTTVIKRKAMCPE